ncbi:MAG: TonB-dependent receptor [Hansschlegelia sp.]
MPAALFVTVALAPIVPALADPAWVAIERNFSIPGGSLSSALVAFGAQAGLQISYVPALAQGKITVGVSGGMPARSALARLLSGTGLAYAFTGPSTVTIENPNVGPATGAAGSDADALDQIDVVGGHVVIGSGADGVPGNSDQPYQTPGSTSFISSEQIDRFRGFSAGDLFKSTPGVIAAGNHNGPSLGVNIRGMQSMNRVKVTIDGTEQTTSTWRGYLGSDDRVYVDQDLIAKVGVTKGPSGGAEGAGAIGGVVAVRTINASDIVKEGQTFGGRIRVGTNNNATKNVRIDSFDQRTNAPGLFDFANGWGNVAIATTQENYDVVLAAAKRKSGNYFAGKHGPSTWDNPNSLIPQPLSYTKPGEEAFNTSTDSSTLLAKATFRPTDEQTVELGFTHYENRFGEAMGSLLTAQDTTWRQTIRADAEADAYNARYRWDPVSDLIDLRVNAFATDVRSNTVSVGPAFYFPPFITPEMRPPAHDRRFAETWTYGANATNTSRFDATLGAFKVDSGVSYVIEDADGKPYVSGRSYADSNSFAILQPSVGTREIASVFARSEYRPIDWLKFNFDLRYDHFAINEKGKPSPYGVYADKEGGRLNPGLGVTLEPVSGLQFYGLYAEGFRPPSLRESIGSDSTLAPNPDLKPEIAKNWEFGVNLSKDDVLLAKDKARMKVAYFINNYDDYISRINNPNPAPGQPFFSVANIDKAMFQGIEMSGSYDVGRVFVEGMLTYYTDFKFCEAGAKCRSGSLDADYALNYLPPKISTGLTVGMRFFDEKLTVGGRISHTGKRLGPLPASAQQTNYWLPYTLVDAFLTYKVTENFSIDVSGENLTDRYYIDALNGWLPSPGRTIRTSLTAQF